jgi:ADP-ribose pyrophosphatase
MMVIWQTDSWRLELKEQILPDGRTHQKAVVVHPGAVVLVPLIDNQVVMLRQYRLALDETIWELPAGTRHWGEDWLVCAQRELREETGYRAARFVSLGEIWPAPGVSDERMALYLALELTPDPLNPDEDEQFERRLRPLAELVGMAMDGRLEDAKSIIGILRAARHLEENGV